MFRLQGSSHHLSHHLLGPGWCLSKQLVLNWGLHSNPGFFVWDAGVPAGVLTAGLPSGSDFGRSLGAGPEQPRSGPPRKAPSTPCAPRPELKCSKQVRMSQGPGDPPVPSHPQQPSCTSLGFPRPQLAALPRDPRLERLGRKPAPQPLTSSRSARADRSYPPHVGGGDLWCTFSEMHAERNSKASGTGSGSSPTGSGSSPRRPRRSASILHLGD